MYLSSQLQHIAILVPAVAKSCKPTQTERMNRKPAENQVDG
jgi:hypothetical protein